MFTISKFRLIFYNLVLYSVCWSHLSYFMSCNGNPVPNTFYELLPCRGPSMTPYCVSDATVMILFDLLVAFLYKFFQPYCLLNKLFSGSCVHACRHGHRCGVVPPVLHEGRMAGRPRNEEHLHGIHRKVLGWRCRKQGTHILDRKPFTALIERLLCLCPHSLQFSPKKTHPMNN